MDVQRKKGIIEVCVLAVLKKGPSYGYMIIRELEQCFEISESTLYPILKRLEQNGSLKTYRQEHNGRIRKYYQLTQEGQYKIDAFLDEWDELLEMYQFVAQQNKCELKKTETETVEAKTVEADAVETGTAAADAGNIGILKDDNAGSEGSEAENKAAETENMKNTDTEIKEGLQA